MMKDSMDCEKTVRLDGFTRRSFVRIASVGAASVALLTLPTPAFADTAIRRRQFVDSLGRNVTVAGTIESVTPVGVHAQTLMTTLCPEGLVSLAKSVDDDASDYEEAGIGGLADLPETGGITSPVTEKVAVYEIEAISPELILDVGLPKDGLTAELDALQTETGNPVFFLDISFGNLPSAYRTLGELLGYQERAEELASYVEGVYGQVRAIAANTTTGCKVFYAPRENGLMVRSGIKVQLDAILFMGATPITSPYDCTNKTVDPGALNQSGVDLVVFDDTEYLKTLVNIEAETSNVWQAAEAILQGKFAVSPALMHSWFGSPVLVQALGILWLMSVIWPDRCQFDMIAESNAFFSLFYGFGKGEQDLAQLIGEYNEAGYNK